MELTPLNTSALASLINSPALRKGNPNDNLLPVFGGDITLEVEGVMGDSEAEDAVDIVENDKLSGVLEEVTEFDFASTSLMPSDDGTVWELTDRVESVAAEECNFRSLFGIPEGCEISLKSISSSMLVVFVLSANAATNTSALLGYKHKLEAFGLGPGDVFGDTPGDVRGEF